MNLQPGIYPDIPIDDYVADKLCKDPSLSSSCAFRLLERSPWHARCCHPRLNPALAPDDSDASDVGSAAHEMLIGGEGKICPIDPADYPGARGGIPKGWTNGPIREARDLARSRGLIPMLKESAQRVCIMASVAREYVARSELAGIFEDSQSELTMIWNEGKATLRSRPDILSNDRRVMLHYKTTKASAEPQSFIRRMFITMGYDVAAAFYERGLRLHCDREPTTVFLVQEQEPPYACSLIGLSPAMAEMAHAKVERAIEIWSQCMRLDSWPSYTTQICYAEPTAWQMAEAESQLSAPVNIKPQQHLHEEMVQA